MFENGIFKSRRWTATTTATTSLFLCVNKWERRIENYQYLQYIKTGTTVSIPGTSRYWYSTILYCMPKNDDDVGKISGYEDTLSRYNHSPAPRTWRGWDKSFQTTKDFSSCMIVWKDRSHIGIWHWLFRGGESSSG